MDFDALLLARIQFAFTVAFHIIFPAFTIGLAAYIATLGVVWLRTKNDLYHRTMRFWTKVFAVSFAMGVVSGIVLSYQFGTNWSRFSAITGNIIGPLIGYEVLTAFFLEATFLGVLLFGFNRVAPWAWVLSAIFVAIGTATSAFWILAANSWMHTPTGHEFRDGIAYPVDWFAIVFNPSFPYRLSHMLNAAYLTTGFVVLAVGARYVLAQRHGAEARRMMQMAIGLLAVLAPLQLVLGDAHGLNTLKHQPIKVAAMEGHWDGSRPVDLILFAWPDEREERNRYVIALPGVSSLILTHDLAGLIPGLRDVPASERPPVPVVFFAFRVMVAIGFFMIAAALTGAFLWWRGRLFTTRWYLHIIANAWWVGFVAVIAGWIVTESGRQPWLVHGVLRTAEGVSPVPGGSVATTLALFVFAYGIVFSAGIYFINRLIARGPEGPALAEPKGLPSRPITGARDATGEAAT